jgi:hypothetical protein
MPMRTVRSLVAALLLGVTLTPSVRAFDVVLNAQGEFLDAYLVNGQAFPPRVVFIDPDPPDPATLAVPPRVGRHVNGKLCFLPRKVSHHRRFVLADDTYRESCLDRRTPEARCAVTDPKSPFFVGRDPDGWAVFERSGKWTGLHIHTPWDFSEPQPQGNLDPQGCVFDRRGRMFGNDVGSERTGVSDGSLLVFFPGRDRRYSTYCFLDKSLADPGMPVMDDAGNLYVPEPAAAKVTKFSPPFPSSAADCDNAEHLVTTPPGKSVFLAGGAGGLSIPVSMVRVPHTRHWYVAGVLGPPVIDEFDGDGAFVRNIVAAGVPKNPIGMDVGRDGTLYYAELNLDPVTFDTRCGSVSMVRFDGRGEPRAPVTLGRHLRFPDGVTVADSSRFAVKFRRLPPAVDIAPEECGGE